MNHEIIKSTTYGTIESSEHKMNQLQCSNLFSNHDWSIVIHENKSRVPQALLRDGHLMAANGGRG